MDACETCQKRRVSILGLAYAAAALTSLTLAAHGQEWTMRFPIERADLSPTGRNPYFILTPGYQLVLEAGQERLVITVTDETKTVEDIETRVVEERETKAGQLVEVSRNFFAISTRTKNVYYFGEDVDVYKRGRVTNHEGTWIASARGSRFGLMMPGEPALHARYYQELAPNVAMDRAEIVGLSDTVATPAGEFTNCLKIEETTPIERGREYKFYARDVGLVQDGSLKLVKYGQRVARIQ